MIIILNLFLYKKMLRASIRSMRIYPLELKICNKLARYWKTWRTLSKEPRMYRREKLRRSWSLLCRSGKCLRLELMSGTELGMPIQFQKCNGVWQFDQFDRSSLRYIDFQAWQERVGISTSLTLRLEIPVEHSISRSSNVASSGPSCPIS